MTLDDHIADELKRALRAGNRHRLRALRLARSALLHAGSGHRPEGLPDQESRVLLCQLRDDALENVTTFADGRRDDLADAEVAEVAVYEELLAWLATPGR